jgi:putative RecB family exonuclease
LSASQPSTQRHRSLLPRRISPSAIDRYRKCPRQLWFQYVAKVPRRENRSPVLVLGNAVHAALERFFGLSPKDRSLQVLHLCLRSVWPHYRSGYDFADVEEEREWGQRALKMLTSFYEQFDVRVVPISREQWVAVRLDNGVELFGKVDRIDGEDSQGPLHVVDYKTGRVSVDSEDLPTDTAARVYALAVAAEYQRRVDRVRLLYLDGAVEARWDPEEEDIEAARSDLTALTWAIYLDSELDARPGDHCRFCAYAHACPAAGRVELEDLVVVDDIAF